MKFLNLHTIKSSFLLSCILLICSSNLFGCQEEEESQSQKELTQNRSNPDLSLGTLQGELRLPEGEECHTFIAHRTDEVEMLFALNIDQSTVRNHQYSFLQDLPVGSYQLKGKLLCFSDEKGEIEYTSLHDDVVVNAFESSMVQFRFFFNVDSDVNRVDLSFCAELMLDSLSPAPFACPNEMIKGSYQVDWLREDCGDIFIQMMIDEQVYQGHEFSFPQEGTVVEGRAPQHEGQYELLITLSSPEGGMIPLYNTVLEVVDCGEPTTEEPTTEEPTTEEPTTEEPTTEEPDHNNHDTEEPQPEKPQDMSYHIELVFEGQWTDGQRQTVEAAALRWESVITADIPDVIFQGEMIDDLRITLSAVDIDGQGGILGRAGFTAVRGGSLLPVTGIMEFDTSDLAFLEQNQLLADVIVHEIAHVIGIGTLWEHLNLVDFSDLNDPIYLGQEAVEAYANILGRDVGHVPVANTGGVGTFGGHWRETDLQNELMTGYINEGANPLSQLSIASLNDLGYEADPSKADPFMPLAQLIAGRDFHDKDHNHIHHVADLLPIPSHEIIVVPTL